MFATNLGSIELFAIQKFVRVAVEENWLAVQQLIVFVYTDIKVSRINLIFLLKLPVELSYQNMAIFVW